MLHRKRSKRAKRDSGGIIVYYKQELSHFITLHKRSDDNLMWIRIDKTIGLEKDLFMAVCYVVPRGSSTAVISKDVYPKLIQNIAELNRDLGDSYNCLIAGDLNARTKELADFVINDTDVYLPLPDDYMYVIDCDILTSRKSKDQKPPNAEG